MTDTDDSLLVLDVCCGPRMMWLDKADPRAVYVDERNTDYMIPPDRAYPSGTVIRVRPSIQASFTNLPFRTASFRHVVFDPPHIQRENLLGTVTKKYGALWGDWREMLRSGFAECFRVLKPGGTLIFKWCDVEVPLKDILPLAPSAPLYGHRSGRKAGTHWLAFVR